MAKIEVKLKTKVGDQILNIDKFNGLKSVSSTSQSSGQPGEIFYGVLPSTGNLNIVDIDGEIKQMIEDGDISNSNSPVDIYANNKLVHSHISSSSDYSILNKNLTLRLSDELAKWDALEYEGYEYAGQSETAYNMLASVLQSLGFSPVTEIPLMLEEVERKLQLITISRPFLSRDTYRATIDKFCQLAQMQVYKADNGIIRFIDAQSNRFTQKDVIDIPPSNQLTQLNKSVFITNKYDAVDITPIQSIIEQGASVTTASDNPSDKELTDTVVGIVNNANLSVEQVCAYSTGRDYYNTQTVYNYARIEVYYLEGSVNINKPSNEQYLDFAFNVNMGGRKYTDINWKSVTGSISSWTEIWTGNGAQSQYLYNSASVPTEEGSPTPEADWSSSTINNGENSIKLQYGFFKDNGIIKIDTLEKTLSNTFSIEDMDTYYKISYKIPVGYFTGFQNVKEDLTIIPNTRPLAISQADELTLSITTSKLSMKDLDKVRVGNGSDVFTYGNNELFAITENDNIVQSQYYNNAKNIISDYKNGKNNADIAIVCADYFNLNNDLIKDWGDGGIVEVGDIIKCTSDDLFKVTGREFSHSGVPKINLQLETINIAHLNFTGLDANGNMEGQQAFDGNIVAYAVGKPNIQSTSSTETIGYGYCNGFNEEYYHYNFGQSYDSVNNMPKIVDSTIFIPSNYKGKPVTKILNNAFRGYNNPVGQEHDFYYQSILVKNIILGDNIEEIGDYSFDYVGEYYIYPEAKHVKIYLPSSVSGLGEMFAANTIVYVKSDIQPLSNSIYNGANTVVFESQVTSISGAIIYSRYTAVPKLVFKHSANQQININIDSAKSATQVTIYSDNLIVNNYDWESKNINATIKPLSEWVEE